MIVRHRFPRTTSDDDEDQVPDAVPDFDQTISSDLDDTVRNLQTLKPRERHTPAILQFQESVLYAQTEEIRALREQLSKVTVAIGYKASKKALSELETNVNARVDRRLDSIRNWTLAVASIVGVAMVVMGMLGLKHG